MPSPSHTEVVEGQPAVTVSGQFAAPGSNAEELEQWLKDKTLKPYTSLSITSKERLTLEFARIRANGWAISEQQLELNHRGIAVPLLDRHGDLVGGLNVSMPMGHESSEDAVARVLPVLRVLPCRATKVRRHSRQQYAD